MKGELEDERNTYANSPIVCTKSVAARVAMPLMTGCAQNARFEGSLQGGEG